MKLDMSLSYAQSCNIDQQLYNNSNASNGNQFIYLNTTTTTTNNNNNNTDNSNYLQRFNLADVVVDSYYSSFNSNNTNEMTCQNQSVLNSSSSSSTSSSSASSYLNLNSINNNNNNKKLKLNLNDSLSNNNDNSMSLSTSTPPTPSSSSSSSSSSNIQLNDELKPGVGMHTTIDFSLIDYSSTQASLNCATFNPAKQQQQLQQQYYPIQQQQQQQQQAYHTMQQQSLVQQPQNYPYYANSNLMQMQQHPQQQQQQPQYIQLPTNSYVNNQQKLAKMNTSLMNGQLQQQLQPKGMYEEFNSEEDDEEEDEEEEDEEDEDEYDEDDEDSMHKHHHKRMRKHNQIDENDYEIKDGAYLNTYFNSPSSLSSSSNPPILTSTSSQSQLAHKHYNSAIDHVRIKDEKSRRDQSSLVVVTKTEQCDDLTQMENSQLHHQTSIDTETVSASASSSPINHSNKDVVHAAAANLTKLSNHQQQQINNMINSYSMAGIMNDHDLVNLPLRELNKRLRSLPKQMAYNMKKRRRTLKNRKYAQNCRSKRLEQKSEMEVQNTQLKIEINRLNKMIEKLHKENTMLKCLMNTNNNKSDDLVDHKECKEKLMICNNNSTSNKPTNMQSNSSNNISQLTHLLSMPLANKSTNPNPNNTTANDHFNYQTKC